MRECEKTGQTWLDLGDLDLEELPPELGDLTHLELLALGRHSPLFADDGQIFWEFHLSRPTHRATDVGPLSKLKGLKTLSLSSWKSVTDLRPLEKLVGLTKLLLPHCESVSDLGPLARLGELTDLELTGCKSVADLKPLGALTKLTALGMPSCASISDLEPLRTLTELVVLHLMQCRSVSDLSPLLDLPRLRFLDIKDTAVSLPDDLRVSTDASAILAWYRENKLATDKRPLAEVKLLLVGQGRVGKTQFRLRFFEGMGIAHHNPTLKSTRHIDCVESTRALPANHRSKLSQVKLRVWDFAGQEELHSSHRFFLGSQRCFYVLVLAADRPANGESSDSNRLNYWLRLIAEYGRRNEAEKAPVLIVVTRSDLDRAKSNREKIDDALEAAQKCDWFGANVVEVVRGLGWSRALSEDTDKAIWEQHRAAAEGIEAAINTHLASVIDLDQEISPIYHAAKAFVEKAFSPKGIDGDGEERTCIAGDDLKRFAELFERSEAQKTEKQREGLRRACLGLLNNLGIVHWVGDVPEINRENRWNLRDIAFNPEWVRRPVYDLIRCGDTNPDYAGFLLDQQVGVLLPERDSGDPQAKELYDRFAFRRDDRARVLELMKACRLVFDMALDGPDGGGLLVPDLLKPSVLPDVSARIGTWMYATAFLPEKVFLRFTVRQYDSIDHHAARCFRNQIVWRKGDVGVVLEAHYSPPGETLPYVLIRSATPKASVPGTVAATVQALFDEIYKEERLGHVQRELIEFGKPSRLRVHGPYVFRCEMHERPATRKRPAKRVPRFAIVFNGVDLGSSWSSLVGLGHLHRLIQQPGKLIAVGEFTRTQRSDAARDYKFRQKGTMGNPSASPPGPSPKFAEYSTKKLKQVRAAAERKLEQASGSELEQTYARRVQELTDEIERRSNPELKASMRSVQGELRKAVDELKARMKDKEIPQEHWGHFDHCTSSAGHEYHFRYEKPQDIAWTTSDMDV
jgi:GTPase SAR1 family protein